MFLMTTERFWIFLLLYILVFFFENPVYPLIDSTVVEANYPFGAARKWGAVGFAAGIGAAGMVADRFGLLSIFPMFAGFFLLTAALIGFRLRKKIRNHVQAASTVSPGSTVKSGKGEKCKSTEREGCYRDLLHNRKYMALLLSTFFFVGPALSHNTYFSFLYLEGGGTIAGMGFVLLLMVIGEAPFMAWAERISSLLTMERAILLAMGVSALRFLWYGTSPSPWLLAATFLLQGVANGIGIVLIVQYIAKLADPAMVSLAIPLYTAVSSNCGAITCQLIGGIVAENFGGWGVYLFYGLLNLAGILIYLLFGLHKREKRIV